MGRKVSCIALASVLLAASSATAQEKKTFLTLDTAQKVAAACQAKAKAEGWKMNITILDDGANLKYFERMDGSYRGGIQISQLKANSSAMLPFSTKQLGEIAQKAPGFAFVPGLLTFEGGIPIKTAAGEHIGSIGVSGGTAEQDGICAQAGLDAVSDVLK